MNSFESAYRKGMVCLHPTDTVPGFTCDPLNESAMARLREIKGHSERPYIGLVGSVEQASLFWSDLTPLWRTILEKIWPDSLSVVMTASDQAPKNMLNSESSLCLRQPHLAGDCGWFTQFLKAAATPIPSTSVNRSGQLPAKNWQEAVEFSRSISQIYIPNYKPSVACVKTAQPSTIIAPSSSGFKVLREGGVSQSSIAKIFDEVSKQKL